MAPQHIPSIRRRLMVLVLACIVPAALMVSVVIGYYYTREREAIAQNTLRTARAMTLAVDQQFSAIEAGLEVLATSRTLRHDDFAGFYLQALEVVKTQPVSNVMLADSSRHQVLNTFRPFGTPLPGVNGTQYDTIFQTGQPTVGDLFVSQFDQRRMLAVGVPVVLDDELAYTLNAGIETDRIQDLLMRQRLPSGWIAGIVDSTGTIVARTQAHQKYLGAKTSENVRRRLLETDEDAIESVSLDGVPVLTVFSRSPTSRWSVIIGIPLEILNAELKRSLQWLIGGTLVLLAVMLAFARYLSLALIRSTRALVPPAVALGHGEPVVLPKAEFREAAELGTAIGQAAERLHQAREAQAQSEAELVKANDALVRSNIDLQQFAFVASHDMRTPLRSIHGYVQLLEKKYGALLDGGARVLMQRTTSAVMQLDQLLQDLLGYARMDATAKPFALVDCNEVLASTLDLLDAEIAQNHARIEHTPLPTVLGDRTQLVQLFQNLLANSLKYHAADRPPQIRVSVRAEAAGGTESGQNGVWVFSVADDGIGIDPRYHQSIFEVFKRLHAAQDYSGVGIGLALCQRIVGRHGGRIWVESTEGEGSTFHFTLPRTAP